MHDKHDLLMKENKEIKKKNKELHDKNIFLETKLNKFQMQKELLSKDIHLDIDNLSKILNKKTVGNISFSDTVSNFFSFTKPKLAQGTNENFSKIQNCV